MLRPCVISGLSPQNFSLRKFLILFPKKPCSEKISYILGNAPLFRPSSKNNNKKKIVQGKWNFLTLRSKKILYFRKPRKNVYIFSKESFSYILRNGNPKKISYILGCGNPKKLPEL